MGKRIVIGLFLLLITNKAWGHPGGNMVSHGEYLYWSYVFPIEDTAHRACVMRWKSGSTPELFLQSDFPASDFMFYAKGNALYIMEQRYLSRSDSFQIRLLKSNDHKKPQELWPWQDDPWRMADGGFFIPTENQIVFARYPEIKCLEKGGKPQSYLSFIHKIKKLRSMANGNILLLGEKDVWLTDTSGKIIAHWQGFLEKIEQAPLARNQLFDVDHHKGKLLAAYWGKRSFFSMHDSGRPQTLVQLEFPYVPHWVAYHQGKAYAFASEMRFDGSNPTPLLLELDTNGKHKTIWPHGT